MQAPNWLIFFYIYLTFAGCLSSAASLDVGEGDTSQTSNPGPSKTDLLESAFNYLLQFYPSSESGSSTLGWDDQEMGTDEYLRAMPKRLFYPPRTDKNRYPLYDDEANGMPTKEEASKVSEETSRWKRSVRGEHGKEDKSRRVERDTSSSNDEDQEASHSWWWTQATVRRSPFSPRLGKRNDEQYGIQYDDEYADLDEINEEDDSDSDLQKGFMDSDYAEEPLSPQRLSLRSTLVPSRFGKRNFAFSPRLGKRGREFAYSPRLGKKGYAFSPRLGKRGNTAFTPRLGKRGDFAFSPRLGKRRDINFSPRLGKRGGDVSLYPRPEKRGNAFSPRLGKRIPVLSSSLLAETWRPDAAQVQQRSVAFSPRLG